jgi:hypothetical protein
VQSRGQWPTPTKPKWRIARKFASPTWHRLAKSLNQIEKAYGANNAILDNCYVGIAFVTNDERTAKRVSGDRDARHEELCRSPVVALARSSDGVAPGDGASATRDNVEVELDVVGA